MEFARVYRAATCGQGTLAAHLTKLPLPSVHVRLVGPLEGALAMVQAIEEFPHVSSLDGPFEHAMPLENIVLKATFVPAHTIVIRPAQHPLTMHHLILELADVAAAIWPLENTVLEDAVVLQRPGVNTPIRPFFRTLTGGSMVLEDTRDHGAVREPVTSRTNDLAAMPQALELCAIGPMEGSVALEFAVVELSLEPGTIREHLFALAFDAIVLELALVA
mmetsp:Transcript_37262/g.93520  ORF Transcript_37262/g.93520 Transcript_37262/m.93520 type:complete len:219 (-) Transcript_37262:856-1512(-)